MATTQLPRAWRISFKGINPRWGSRLGDIYYGGTKAECDAFLRLWPFHVNPADASSAISTGTSLALNGNHEMYSGGESYFNTILPALGQTQSFFCLENQYWRMIGLDTAYAGGHLRPSSPDDPITTQWNWLIEILRDRPKRANIFLTHHQPVSAHTAEWTDSQAFQGRDPRVASYGRGWGRRNFWLVLRARASMRTLPRHGTKLQCAIDR